MPRGRRRRGITQLISGAGGRAHYKIDFRAQQLVSGNDSHYGALRLDLSPGRVSWRFVTSDGRDPPPRCGSLPGVGRGLSLREALGGDG